MWTAIKIGRIRIFLVANHANCRSMGLEKKKILDRDKQREREGKKETERERRWIGYYVFARERRKIFPFCKRYIHRKQKRWSCDSLPQLVISHVTVVKMHKTRLIKRYILIGGVNFLCYIDIVRALVYNNAQRDARTYTHRDIHIHIQTNSRLQTADRQTDRQQANKHIHTSKHKKWHTTCIHEKHARLLIKERIGTGKECIHDIYKYALQSDKKIKKKEEEKK